MSKPASVFRIFCRYVGPGGTTVAFYPKKEGLKGIWFNENCPYPPAGADKHDKSSWQNEDTYEANDGHNVSILSWEQLENTLMIAIKKGLYDPKKLKIS